MNGVVVRLAGAPDAAALLDLYAYYVEHTSVTFETSAPSCEAFSARIHNIMEEYPFIVLEKDARIVAYAYAHRFHERAAYGWNAELSVYTAVSEKGRGAGSALYGALIRMLQLQNIQNIYAVIAMPNEASVALHHKFGFEQIGEYRKTAYKLGKWHDAAIMERSIGAKACPPEPFIPLCSVPRDRVEAILTEAKQQYIKNIGR